MSKSAAICSTPQRIRTSNLRFRRSGSPPLANRQNGEHKSFQGTDLRRVNFMPQGMLTILKIASISPISSRFCTILYRGG